MNGRQAKRIRRQVYGDDFSPKFREYKKITADKGVDGLLIFGVTPGQIVADPRRQAYQKAKRRYTRCQD